MLGSTMYTHIMCEDKISLFTYFLKDIVKTRGRKEHNSHKKAIHIFVGFVLDAHYKYNNGPILAIVNWTPILALVISDKSRGEIY